jgi:hypothetical protein
MGNKLPSTHQTPSIFVKTFQKNVHRYSKIFITRPWKFAPPLPSLGSNTNLLDTEDDDSSSETRS